MRTKVRAIASSVKRSASYGKHATGKRRGSGHVPVIGVLRQRAGCAGSAAGRECGFFEQPGVRVRRWAEVWDRTRRGRVEARGAGRMVPRLRPGQETAPTETTFVGAMGTVRPGSRLMAKSVVPW